MTEWFGDTAVETSPQAASEGLREVLGEALLLVSPEALSELARDHWADGSVVLAPQPAASASRIRVEALPATTWRVYWDDYPYAVAFHGTSFDLGGTTVTALATMAIRMIPPYTAPPVPAPPPPEEAGVFPMPTWGGISIRALHGIVVDMDTPIVEDGVPHS